MTDPAAGPRRLYRSRNDKMLGGVAGGVGRFFGVDPTLVRLAFVVLVFAGLGIIAYLVAWIVVPWEPPSGDPQPPRVASPGVGGRMVIGAFLIAIGVMLLVDWALPSLDRFIWPLALIGIGASVIVFGSRR
ncbi:PspC domain-containing protein [bacterium]|nr:PspC domain-containing protein [bacterium]